MLSLAAVICHNPGGELKPKRIVELIKINIESDKAVADSYNIETAPAFVLQHRGKELWRQVGELTVDELRLVLEEF